jgi:uncharacterized protein with HEPN domain
VRTDLVLLKHIRDCIELVQSYVKDVQQPMEEPLTRDAVLREIQIIAQSAMQLSDTLKSRHPEINWSQLRAFRNVLVHDYMNIKLDLVESAIQDDLQVLKRVISAEILLLEDK